MLSEQMDFSQQYLKTLYNSTHLFVFRIDLNFNFTFFNKALLTRTGVTNSSEVTLSELLYPADNALFLGAVAEAIRSPEKPVSVVARFGTIDYYQCISWEITCILDAYGDTHELQALGVLQGNDVLRGDAYEEGLIETVNHFRAFANNAPMAMCIFSENNELIMGNKFLQKLLNIKRQNSDNGSGHFDQILWNSILENNAKVLATNTMLSYEKEVFADNQLRYFHTIKFPLKDSLEQTIAIGAIYLDVTEKKKQENELVVRERRLSSLLNSNSAFLIRIDKQGYYLYVNKAYTLVFGKTNDELRGKSSLENVHPNDSLNYYEVLRDCIENAGKVLSVDLRIFDSEGNQIYSTWEFVAVSDFIGNVYEIQAVGWNISNLIHQQEEIKKLALVAQRTQNAVVITDQEGIVEWVNEGYTRMTEYTMSDVFGKKAYDLLIGPETNSSTIRYIYDCIESKKAFNVDITNYSRSGRKYWCNVDAIPVYNDHGEVIKFMAIESDITEKKEQEILQQQLVMDLLQKNKNLEEFSYILSHNLRSPVSNILGLINIFKFSQSQKVNANIVESLKKAASQLDTVIKDVNQIISYRKNLSELKEPIKLFGFTNEIIGFFNPELDLIDHEIENDLDRSLTVNTIGSYLQSVLSNLISNAIKYRKPKGKLKIKIHSKVTDENVKIYVSDNGIGIDLKLYKNKVFGLYKRFHLNVEGKGMGLYMCKQQLEILGGTIDLKSTPEEGTTFIVSLPFDH